MSVAAAATGLVALVLSSVASVPQAVRVLRAPDRAEGVSVAAWSVVLLSQVAWATWAVRHDNWWLVGASVLPTVGSLAVLVPLWRTGGRRWAVPATVLGAVVVACLPDVVLAPLVTAVSVVPALLQLRRVRRHGAQGVSAGTWGLAAGRTSCWMLHAVLVGDPVLFLPGVVLLPASLALVYRARSAPQLEVEPVGDAQPGT